ncbi:MAG: bifunctional DNA-formamidopyrimidine glycosylase/DNA-(apurinic or apyrimidinic site) lyase [Candidatus Andersenbacteria bacterium]
MPELPEVESQARDVKHWVVGRPIQEVWVGNKKTVATPGVPQFIKQLKGRRFKKVSRRGKFILMELDGGLTLVSHFRMTGHFRLASLTKSKSAREWYIYPPDRFSRVAFKLDRGDVLHYTDIRKFGRLWLVPTKKVQQLPELAELGPEPLDKSFTPDKFATCVRRFSGMIKPVLLNQSCVAGIGNIYADESLFDAAIHPKTRVQKLSDEQLHELVKMVIANLGAAVKHRGSSVGEFTNIKGDAGKHGLYLRVYQQTGEKCQRRRNGKPCGGVVKRIVVGQRGTHICPVCQKVKR